MIGCKVTMAMVVMLFGLIIVSSMSVYAAEGGRVNVHSHVAINAGVHIDVGGGTQGGGGGGGGEAVFDVTQYNTIGNGEDDSDDYGLDSQNSVAFRQAWEAACNTPGPTKIVVPQGKFMIARALFAGPCQSPHITFEIQGTLVANHEPSYYSSPEWFAFEHVNGVTVTGPGVLDATGAYQGGPGTCRSDDPTCVAGPTTIKFLNVTNGVIDGVQSVNAMGFHIFIMDSCDVTVRNTHITSPPDVLNSDGIHVETSEAITIIDNIVATGEDCVSVGNGSLNITVSGITCGPGHGISVGSLAKYEFKAHEIVVKNCTLKGTFYGARIKHWPQVEGISDIVGVTFEDLTMENVVHPIVIDHGPEQVVGQGNHGRIADVHFKNIRGTAVEQQVVNIACTPLIQCENIEVSDISLTVKGQPAAGAVCLSAKVIFGGKHDGLAC